jgi:hypothetical protein
MTALAPVPRADRQRLREGRIVARSGRIDIGASHFPNLLLSIGNQESNARRCGPGFRTPR